MKYLAAIVVGLALLGTNNACAQSTVYNWKVGAGSYVGSASQACKDYVAFCNGSPTSCPVASTGSIAGDVFTFSSVTFGTFPAATCLYTRTRSGTVLNGSTATTQLSQGQGPQCSSSEKPIVTGSGTAASSSCVDGCAARACGVGMRAGGGYAQTYCLSGAACGTSVASSTIDSNTSANGTSCDATGTICADDGSGGKNCGTFNGDRVCVGSIPPGTCVGYASGGVACAGASGGTSAPASPPAPNNGTSGVPATPDATVSNGDTTYNYYGGTTVASSGSTPTTGAPTGAGGGSAANPIGSAGQPVTVVGGSDGEGDGGGDDGTACDAGACDESLPTLDEVGTVGDAFGSFWGSLQSVPIVEAAGNIAPSFSGGSCPAWSTSVALYSSSIDVDFTSMCTLWTDISPALTIVCLVMFGFLAFRILLSA